MIVVGAGTGVLLARAALPRVLTWLANLGLGKMPGYRGSVQKIGIDFTAPSVVVQGLTIAKFHGSKTEQLLDINSAVIGSQWRSILTGALVGYIKLDSPRLLLHADIFRRKPGESAGKPSPDRNSTSEDNRQPWQERVKQLPAFRLTSVVLTDSELRLRGIAGQDGTDIKIG
jgi:hypothetical protein